MKKYILFSLLIIVVASCQKEIDIDLNDANPKMVIEANYIATDSIVQVRITKTSSYFDAYSSNLINGATVTIRENGGSIVVIPAISDGVYRLTNYAPNYGATYTIEVSYEGISYTASSKLMPVMQLLPSTLQYQEESIFSDEGYWVIYRFQDFPGLGNCYKLIPTYSDTTFSKFGEFASGSDNLTDGNLVERPLIKSFQVGDTIRLELQSINQRVYDYYSQLSSNTSGFTAAAGNPDYFWSNEALGYFSAYGYSTDIVVVVE